jgi:3',5'-cyclic AMP phosphodiesterase CpdA
MTTFVHLTDLHISAPEPVDTGLHSDTTATQHAVREMIDGMATPPAFILVSGDLTNHGDLASYQSLRTMMSDLKMPVLYALGNHDTRAGFYAGMLDRAETTLASYDHEAVIEGVHVITLDTSRPDKIGGELDDAQFAFLQAALANQPGLPKILMFHHAPALVMDPDWEWVLRRHRASGRGRQGPRHRRHLLRSHPHGPFQPVVRHSAGRGDGPARGPRPAVSRPRHPHGAGNVFFGLRAARQRADSHLRAAAFDPRRDGAAYAGRPARL